MKRYYQLLLVLIPICLLPVTSLFAMQDGQATITVTVEDDYTNAPVESVLVRLLDGGSEIASGTTNQNGTAELLISVTSIDEPRDIIPESFQVSESYPNPFEKSSNVDLQVDEAQEVKAEIYNIIGQRVASLQVNLTPGTYTLQSSLGHLAQGVYFLRIFGLQAQTIKMTKVGDRIFSGGSILDINPATFVTRNGPGATALTLDEHTGRNLTLVASNESFDTGQQSIQVVSDTSLTIELSRNNEVIFRVADEASPSQDVAVSLLVEGEQFSEGIITPDTLTLKSGFYTLNADEGNTDAINETIEIASEDQTVTVITQLKTLGNNQLQLEGVVTEESTGTPVNRAHIYLLNDLNSDTLAGPLFADDAGTVDEIVNLEGGPDFDLSVLYRKDGYEDFESAISVSLPDTLVVDQALTEAPAPAAAFTVSGDLQAGSPVIFDASASTGASGEELTYSWDFGNGKRGFSQSISHVYARSINATVTLTVSGDFGVTGTATESINISNSPNPPATTIINGEITTVGLEPLEGVTANLVNDDRTSVSGTDGKIIISDLPSGVPVVMQLNKPDYATQTVRFTPDENSAENFFTTAMIPLEQPVTIPAIENGTNMSGKFGTRVSLPVDALVDANGALITGEVDLTMTPLDVSSDEIFGFPGGFEGVRPDGEQGNIVSFGVADFTFSQNGETLQMMPGKSAEIEIPVTNANVETGDVIPLWTLDEETGLWIEEGTGEIIASSNSPTGLAMLTETGHFSWKNIDVFTGGTGTGVGTTGSYTLIPRCKNSETNQFTNCTLRGRSLNSDGTVAGYAPTVVIPSGGAELPIPLNKTFEISAVSGQGQLAGSASVPPVTNSGEVIELIINLSPRTTLDAIPIAYGDLLKGKSTLSEITRYKFEGDQEDFIKIRLREAVGFEGTGDVFLLNSDEMILQQGSYANNFSRYLFENLPENGTYYIDVVASSEVSNFDISLDLFDGPVNREISYGERIFDFLWPGTVNIYTFQGETDDVLEIIAQNIPGEGSLNAELKLNTTNPLVSESFAFFNYNVWVNKLEEKDGTYTLEVGGANDRTFGEYLIDVNTIDNFIDEDSEIAYGDSILSPIYELGQEYEYTFEGDAGDLIRLHTDKPYTREISNRLFPLLRLYDPNDLLLDEISASFGTLGDAGIGYILPVDGTYKVELTGNANDLSPEGDLFSLLLQETVNPPTKDFDDATFGIFQNEFFENELDINLYTFTGKTGRFGRLQLYPAFASRPNGKIFIFDENHQLIAGDTFNSSTNSNSRKRSILDFQITDQAYRAIVVSNSREDVKQVSNQDYRLHLINAESITFNTTTNLQIPSDSFIYYRINNIILGTEVSVAAVGSGYDSSFLRDPNGDFINLNFFLGSQSFIPMVFEKIGNYFLRVASEIFGPADIDLTVVELEPSETFSLTPNDIVSLSGGVRLSGDIDRFDFSPDAAGTITISLKPANSNSIDDNGNLRIVMRNPDTNALTSASSENPSPIGEELYIWEGEVSAQNEYRIHVWDQDAVTTGDFILEVEFTPDP